MSKQHKISTFSHKPGAMTKLMKSILTNKAARSASAMSAFAATVVSVGAPWQA